MAKRRNTEDTQDFKQCHAFSAGGDVAESPCNSAHTCDTVNALRVPTLARQIERALTSNRSLGRSCLHNKRPRSRTHARARGEPTCAGSDYIRYRVHRTTIVCQRKSRSLLLGWDRFPECCHLWQTRMSNRWVHLVMVVQGMTDLFKTAKICQMWLILAIQI